MSDRLHTVRNLIPHSPNIFELLLDRHGVDFEVGDCVALFDESRRESRPYSLAGGIHEDVLRVLFRAMPEGVVTSWLKRVTPGDQVQVSAPFGWFRPGADAPDAPIIFIATSTGIAPFASYVRSVAKRPPAQILYGVRTRADAIGYEALSERCPVSLAISRERVAGHHHGRVTELLHTLPLEEEPHIYLCGLDAMIDEACDWLQAHGVPLTHLHREVFFYAEAGKS